MAQSITGTDLLYSATAARRKPVIELRAAFGAGVRGLTAIPSDWTTGSTDVTSSVLGVSWSRQLDANAPLGLGQSPVATMTVELDNYAQVYSPLNSGGPLYSIISKNATLPSGATIRYPTLWQTPVRLRMGYYDLRSTGGSEFLTVFSGLVDEIDEQYGVSGSQVRFKCLDYGAGLIKYKLSTSLRINSDVRAHIVNLLQRAWPGVNLGGIVPIGAGPYDDHRPLFTVPYQWLDDDNVYGECVKAAASEGAYFLIDELGLPRFYNAMWWAELADATVSVFEFTTARFSDLTPGYDYDSVATGALVEYQGRKSAGEQVIWRSTDTIVVPPGTETIRAKFEYPCETVYPPTLAIDWFPTDAGGLTLAVTAQLTEVSAQRCTITITNPTQQAAYIPTMQLRGMALYGGPQQQVERNVTTPLVGTSIARVTGNPYIQTKAQAELVADLVADRMQYPRLTYEIRGVPAIPWLQLGDCVTITASEPVTSSRTANITKLEFSWKPDSMFLMNVQAVDRAGLFPYSSYFKLGTHAYNESGPVTFR